jgi:exodeoxyribonuclease V beta subunit
MPRPDALYPKPDQLRHLPHPRSAVIEASAGTGKTYLLEHLVLDRLIDGDLRIENILVVTFTDKGAAELGRRLRAAIDRLLAVAAGAAPPDGDVSDPERCWRLDAAAVQRLQRARQSFDRATIATMHGFCQTVLTENPFASQRLFSQRHVDSAQIFGLVFRDVLRRRLTIDADLLPYVTAWLESGRKVVDLESLLFEARRFAVNSPWAVAFDPAHIAAAVADFLALMDDGGAARAALAAQIGNLTKSKSAETRLDVVATICRSFAASGDLPTLLRDFDAAVEKKDFITYLETKLPPKIYSGDAERLRRAFFALLEAVVPLGIAVAHLCLPLVNQALHDHKRQNGLFDFDDMLALVAESLDGPHGEGLIRSLRARYHCALIDEFQDTDPIQWRIFRRLFLDSEEKNPLIIVGDPKQAIYGFRGADVRTYLAARQAVSGTSGPAVHLMRNYRSTPAVIGAYNAILDQQSKVPFFDAGGDILYDRPVSAAREGAAGPAVTLLQVTPTLPGQMRARDVRRTVTQRIAREIRALLDGPAPPPAGEIFVLTRTGAEGEAVAAALRETGVPFTFFKQDGLYQTKEAKQVLDLLAAVDDPENRSKRLRAWLTPFFGLALRDLPACAAVGPDHPLRARLQAWKAMADERQFEALFHRILDDSGVIRRELFAGAGQRRLTNYLHIFDLLLAQTAKGQRGLSDLIIQFGGLQDSTRKPDPEDGNVQRRESDADAVQIMTMHKAKGLEAEVVFLYGGFTAWSGGYRKVRAFTVDGQRVAHYGRPRRTAIDERMKAEQSQDDQRLLYVALTRARSRLYLPYFGSLPAGDEELETPPRETETWDKLKGGYRHLNRRLQLLVGDAVFNDPRREFFVSDAVPCPPEPNDETTAAAARIDRDRRRAWQAWRPPAALLADDSEARARPLAALRRRKGFTITSYSRIKQAHGGFQAPEDPLDDGLGEEDAFVEPATGTATVTAPSAATVDRAGDGAAALPGGALSGIFLHAVLEAIPQGSLAGRPSLPEWIALPAVREVFARAMHRFDRQPEHLADAQRLVYTALTTPIALSPQRRIDGIGQVERLLREVEFVYPALDQPAASKDDGGAFVKGFIDFIVEVDGRVYLGDWKSDWLPTWEPAAVSAHVAANYELQARLYAIALVKMLGIASAADYAARFGGMIFVFLRGLPGAVHLWRPTWTDVVGWRAELPHTVGAATEEPS